MARTILVVDDEPTLRETLADGLTAEGFSVVTAADGARRSPDSGPPGRT